MSETMTQEQAKQAYSSLPASGQARFLAILAHDITIWARAAYPELVEDREIVAVRLRALNELQHRVTSHTVHLLEGDEKRYPDDVLIAILFELAQSAGCDTMLARSFEDLEGAVLRSGVPGNGADRRRVETIPHESSANLIEG